jgi:hypothetical protein
MSSSPSDRETRLNSLRLKLGRELEEDFRKASSDLIDTLIHDFEREILLAESFASREDPMETVYHRTTAEMIHKTLKTLESIKK